MRLKYQKEIDLWIEENRDKILKIWTEISKIPAIKAAPQPNAPFGNACANALCKCAEVFENSGFDTTVYSEDGYALVNYGNGSKVIGIFSHSDVVPAGDDWIYTSPFEPVIKDGVLIGRGVEDNKSGIMIAFCVMEILKKYNIPLSSAIQLFIGSDEETGMNDIEAFTSRHRMPDISIVPDADFPCSTGEKGIMHLWANCSQSCCDIYDFYGGEAFNIVLDKATAVIRYSPELKDELLAKSSNDIEVTHYNDRLTVKAKGIAKHACDPEGSVNAAYLLAELLADANALCETDRSIMKQIKHILSCPFGTSMGLEHTDELFGRLTFVNGMLRLADGQIRLSFDMRYSSAINSKNIEAKVIDSFKRLGWNTAIESNSRGFAIDPNSKIPETLERIYSEVTGLDKKSVKLGGGTYARKLKNAFSVGTFSETVLKKESPVISMPTGHGGAHQADEMIDIDAFFTAVKIITSYILAVDEEVNCGK